MRTLRPSLEHGGGGVPDAAAREGEPRRRGSFAHQPSPATVTARARRSRAPPRRAAASRPSRHPPRASAATAVRPRPRAGSPPADTATDSPCGRCRGSPRPSTDADTSADALAAAAPAPQGQTTAPTAPSRDRADPSDTTPPSHPTHKHGPQFVYTASEDQARRPRRCIALAIAASAAGAPPP